MTYLFNELKPKGKAHVWNGADTACTMWTTGGFRHDRAGWVVEATPRLRPVCQMCMVKTGVAPRNGVP